MKVLDKSGGDWWYMDVKGKEGWAPVSHVVVKKAPKVVPTRKIYKFVAEEITLLILNYTIKNDLKFI